MIIGRLPFAILLQCALCSSVHGFAFHSSSSSHFALQQRRQVVLSAEAEPEAEVPTDPEPKPELEAKDDDGAVCESPFQRFGDFVNTLTGKDEWEFGDLARWADGKVKTGVSKLTGKEYEVGDLAYWIDGKIKDRVNKYTGEDSYEFGDIAEEVLERILSGEYDVEDIFASLQVMGALGANSAPIASVIPVKMLLDLVNFGLENKKTGEVILALAGNLDSRLMGAVSAAAEGLISEEAKDEIEKQILSFIGKDSIDDYKLGDIAEKIKQLLEAIDAEEDGGEEVAIEERSFVLPAGAEKELEDWINRQGQMRSSLITTT